MGCDLRIGRLKTPNGKNVVEVGTDRLKALFGFLAHNRNLGAAVQEREANLLG